MADKITLKAGDTDPLELTISATNLENLDDLNEATIYIRDVNASTNHVTGEALAVESSSTRTLSFDPTGAKVGGGDALDAEGDYRAYILATWTDGTTTRHPGKGHRQIIVQANWES